MTVSGSRTGRESFIKRIVGANAFAETAPRASPEVPGASRATSLPAFSARKRLRCTSSAFGARRSRRAIAARVPPHPARSHRLSTVSDAKHRAMSPWSSSGADDPAAALCVGSSRDRWRNDSDVRDSSPHVKHVSVTADAPVNARRVGQSARCRGTTPRAGFVSGSVAAASASATSSATASSVSHRNSCASCCS